MILFRQDEETHNFYGKDRAAGALRFLRTELAYVATMHPDTPDDRNKTRSACWTAKNCKPPSPSNLTLFREKMGKVSTQPNGS